MTRDLTSWNIIPGIIDGHFVLFSSTKGSFLGRGSNSIGIRSGWDQGSKREQGAKAFYGYGPPFGTGRIGSGQRSCSSKTHGSGRAGSRTLLNLADRVESNQVGSRSVRNMTVRVGSGRVGSGRVRSGRVGSGQVGSGRVGSDRVGSRRVWSGGVRSGVVRVT